MKYIVLMMLVVSSNNIIAQINDNKMLCVEDVRLYLDNYDIIKYEIENSKDLAVSAYEINLGFYFLKIISFIMDTNIIEDYEITKKQMKEELDIYLDEDVPDSLKEIFNKYNIQNGSKIRILIEIGILSIGLERALDNDVSKLPADKSEWMELIMDKSNRIRILKYLVGNEFLTILKLYYNI
jgi:hypothetical protein